MKTLFIVVAAVVVGVGIGVATGFARLSPADQIAIPEIGGAGPALLRSASKVAFDEVNHNFGTMQRGATRQHTFKVRNEGKARLVLTAGQPTCKCTKFEVTPEPLEPGEEAKIVLEWEARSAPGPFRQSAPVHTNDPIRPLVTLTVEGDVVDPAGLEPTSFELGEVRSGDDAMASVVFYSNDREDLQVEATVPEGESAAGLFTIGVERASPDELPSSSAKAGYRITLESKPGLPLGHVMEWVTLKTNLEDTSELQVPVFGRVVGDISVHGSGWTENTGMLNLGNVKSSEGESRKLVLSVKGDHASGTQFELVSADPPELKVTLGEPKRRSDTVYHTPITIEIPKGTRQMVHLGNAQGEAGVIRIKSTHPKTSEVKLGVRFSVSG